MLELNRIYFGDYKQYVSLLPDESVDMVLTDPPFAIKSNGKAQNYNRKAENVVDSYAEITIDEYYSFLKRLCDESYRVLKEHGALWIVSGWTNLDVVMKAVKDAGFFIQNHLIWKYNFGVFTVKQFVTSHYHILFCVKNPKKYFFHKFYWYPEDVLLINREYQRGGKKTPNKLPKALVQRLLLFGSKENDVILDMCAGSGTTLYVAKMMKRRFIGMEIIEDIYFIAKENIDRVEWGNLEILPEQTYGYPYAYYQTGELLHIEEIARRRLKKACQEVVRNVQALKQTNKR